MRTFLVPALPGEAFQAYCARMSGLDWQFAGHRELSIVKIGVVRVDGDKPAGSNYEEVIEEAP